MKQPWRWALIFLAAAVIGFGAWYYHAVEWREKNAYIPCMKELPAKADAPASKELQSKKPQEPLSAC